MGRRQCVDLRRRNLEKKPEDLTLRFKFSTFKFPTAADREELMRQKILIKQRAGLALLLVIGVLAFAAIIGFAMLSSASMQAQTTLNSNLALTADALAD